MLKLLEKKGSLPWLRRCPLTAGQRVSRRYRRANIRRIEYRRLKAIVPAIAERNKVTKVEVIEEAIKYIDELHKALYARVPLIHSNHPSLFNVSSSRCLFGQILPFDPVRAPPATSLTPASESRTTGCLTPAPAASVSAAKHIQQTHQRFQAYLAQRAAIAQLQRQRNCTTFSSNANIQSNGQTGFIPADSLLCGALRSVQSNTKQQNL